MMATYAEVKSRELLAKKIDDAKASLDAILEAIDSGDDAALRWICRAQLPGDINNVAGMIEQVIAERVPA